MSTLLLCSVGQCLTHRNRLCISCSYSSIKFRLPPIASDGRMHGLSRCSSSCICVPHTYRKKLNDLFCRFSSERDILDERQDVDFDDENGEDDGVSSDPTSLPSTYIHTYIHTYMHTYMHTCMHAYIHTYMHTYMHTYIHTYIHT